MWFIVTCVDLIGVLTLSVGQIWGSSVQASASVDVAIKRSRTNGTTSHPRQRNGPALSARLALRLATHDIHERMHHHPALARLAAGTIGRDEYCRVLARSYGFYIMAESALGLGGKLTDCLVADMTELGMTPAAIAALPRCTNLGCVQEHSALIGARYVLIGASLGGKVMARAVTGWTGGDGALPVRFLTGMSENDWKAFASGLETHLPDSTSRSRAAKAATAMFAAYENWMVWD